MAFIIATLLIIIVSVIWHDHGLTKWLREKEFRPIDHFDLVETIIPGQTFFVPTGGVEVILGHEFTLKRLDGTEVILVGHLWMMAKPLWAVKEVIPLPPKTTPLTTVL